jgi:hypothetical protein
MDDVLSHTRSSTPGPTVPILGLDNGPASCHPSPADGPSKVEHLADEAVDPCDTNASCACYGHSSVCVM